MGVYAIAASAQPVDQDGPVERARRGDFAAYEELYRRYVGRIHAVCLRMTASPQRAEELTQDAFVRAWERLGTFHGGRFGPWLHRVAVNVVLSDWRSRSRREHKEQEFDGAVEARTAVTPADPRHRLDLEQAIAGLPERGRAVFVLYDIEGYRHAEIAEKMGITEGTSKAQLHRARRLLREALAS